MVYADVFSAVFEPDMSDAKRARHAHSSIKLSTTIYNLRQSLETGDLQDGLVTDIVFRVENFVEK